MVPSASQWNNPEVSYIGISLELPLLVVSVVNMLTSLPASQVDKLDASESLRKQEEQNTESQPIVYGTVAWPLHNPAALLVEYVKGGL